MTTPTDILTQLQAAWGTVATVADATVIESTGLNALHLRQLTKPCGVHLPPFDAIEETSNRRPGFVRSKCRHCGRFLGYKRES